MPVALGGDREIRLQCPGVNYALGLRPFGRTPPYPPGIAATGPLGSCALRPSRDNPRRRRRCFHRPPVGRALNPVHLRERDYLVYLTGEPHEEEKGPETSGPFSFWGVGTYVSGNFFIPPRLFNLTELICRDGQEEK